MNRKIVVTTILCHMAIFFFTVLISSQVIASFNGHIILEVINFVIVTCLYVGSGYVIAKNRKGRYDVSYFAVFFLGLGIWAIAFMSSPDDLNWKFGKGGVWLLYRLYVFSYDITLGRLIHFANVQINMVLLLTLSILPSTFMMIGKIIREGKTLPNKTQPAAWHR